MQTDNPGSDRPLPERIVERVLFASRWLLAPIYLGLAFVLAALVVKFFQEIGHLLGHILELSESGVILVALTLVDLSLVGGLIVMVMFSSYENFVSRIDARATEEHNLGWMGKLDAGGLKLKVATSIVAISSIQLLKVFMAAGDTPNDKLFWYATLHLVFVVAALLLAVLDRLSPKH